MMRVALLPILSIMWILAEPIIHFLFERYAFDSSTRALVSTLFFACECLYDSLFLNFLKIN